MPWNPPDPSSSNSVGSDSTGIAVSKVFGPDPEPSSRSKDAKKSSSDAAFNNLSTSGCVVVVTITVVGISAAGCGSAAELSSPAR